MFGGFARYFESVLPDFEPFLPNFLRDFYTVLFQTSLIADGNGEFGGWNGDFGAKNAIFGDFGACFGVGGFVRYFERVLPDFEPFPPNFLRDFTQPLSKSL